MNVLMGTIFLFLALMFVGAAIYNVTFKSAGKRNVFTNRFGENRLSNSRTALALNIVMLLTGLFIGYLGFDLIVFKS